MLFKGLEPVTFTVSICSIVKSKMVPEYLILALAVLWLFGRKLSAAGAPARSSISMLLSGPDVLVQPAKNGGHFQSPLIRFSR